MHNRLLLLLLIHLLITLPGHAQQYYQSYNQAHGNIYTYNPPMAPNPVLWSKCLNELQKAYALRSKAQQVKQFVYRASSTGPAHLYYYDAQSNRYIPVEDNINGVQGPYGD